MLLLARTPGVTVATFGDMIRVPGIESSLEQERAQGADVRIVYSPRDALELARADPSKQVVFLAVGFETTAPGVASMVLEAVGTKTENFSLLVLHKLVLPAMEAVLDGEAAIDGFLTPGHVSVIIGANAYEPFVKKYGVPCVATGFEPYDILDGLGILLELVVGNRAESVIQYTRAVTPEGNKRARDIMMEVFETIDVEWRGLGAIPESGLGLREAFAGLDAQKRFALPYVPQVKIEGCRCGEVLKGLIDPDECPLLGGRCTPGNPVGPCMVSSEGSCAARYKYG